jgi:pantoate--beta-alanine ligase
MQTIRSLQAMAGWRETLYRDGVIVGLVPTMGALHEGHRALIRAARLSCDAVVVSLFVNPRQFAPNEDLGRYPRPFRSDAALCRAEGADVLFAPAAAAVYPPGFATSVSIGALARRWEGERRPGHLDGIFSRRCWCGGSSRI